MQALTSFLRDHRDEIEMYAGGGALALFALIGVGFFAPLA